MRWQRMRPSKARIGMFWAIGLYLALVLALFSIVKLVAHVTDGQAVEPYLALAVPGVPFLLLVSRLWKWEQQGLPPTRLAIWWG